MSLEEAQDDFNQNRSTVLIRIDHLIRQIVSGQCEDLKTLHMILHFVGNCF